MNLTMFFNVEWKKSDIRTLAVCFHLSLVTGKIKKKKKLQEENSPGSNWPLSVKAYYLPTKPTYL